MPTPAGPSGLLFTNADLQAYLQQTIDTATGDLAQRIASGWLAAATNQTSWPDPIPDTLFAWALELGAIAYRNPDGVSTESIDDHSVSFDRLRRKEILDKASAFYGGSNVPLSSFPEPDWHWAVVPTVSPLVN